MNLDINVHGAPNFRTPRRGRDLNVFGVAQPRTQGLRAILSILRARPGTPNPTRVIWFSAREEPVGEHRDIVPVSSGARSLQSTSPVVPSFFAMRHSLVLCSDSPTGRRIWRRLSRGSSWTSWPRLLSG
jgi:hypothetical protein